jgi:nicotinate-nucleotide--dimethylbenzimidazole phosphoribosyltransferase
MKIAQILDRIGPLDEVAMAAAVERLNNLIKPPGSLGRLEPLIIQMAGILGAVLPTVAPATVLIFAGDHGVTAEGVSAYPSDVTPQMVINFLRGGAAINALAGNAGAKVVVVDAGMAHAVVHPDLVVRTVRPGTANMVKGPAMSRAEAEHALRVGMEVARTEIARGANCLLLGEMGIGNTTPSAAMLAAFSGRAPGDVCGRGTGLDDAGVLRKVRAVQTALAVNQPDPGDPIDVLAKVGGLEIGALAGAMLAAAAERVPVVLDGFIVGVAALLACRMAPRTGAFLIASHCSAERGHRLVLELLGLKPLVELDLRLGEGSGAALALPLLQAACRVMRDMATFAEAGVSGAGPDAVQGEDHGDQA